MIPFQLSENLSHTWFIDLDGTILKHNGYLTGNDELLPGVKELWKLIPEEDCIIITTGRSTEYKESSLKILADNGLRYNHAIFGLPLGERIVLNDLKPNLKTAIAWNVERDKGFL
jgi:hydroxymethylpyrimidine pyrophosphatase-like HAD family hydrolase